MDADEALQLQHEAELAGFRPATLTGTHPSELRERALAEPQRFTLGHLALALVLVSGGFLIGRAIGRALRKQPKKVIGLGLDVFAARRV